MKTKIHFTFFFLFVVVLTSCEHCDCKDKVELADLVVDGVEQTSDIINDTTVYDIIHYVLNTIEGLVCDDVESASDHSNEIPIIYSQDGSFGQNAITVSSKEIQYNGELPPDGMYMMRNRVVFEVDGFYNIDSSLDIYDEVVERSDGNNYSSDPVGRKSINPEKNKKGKIVLQVTSTGNLEPTKFDINGNPIYISKWKTEIIK